MPWATVEVKREAGAAGEHDPRAFLGPESWPALGLPCTFGWPRAAVLLQTLNSRKSVDEEQPRGRVVREGQGWGAAGPAQGARSARP